MILTEIILALPIGIIFNILVYNINDIINKGSIYEDTIQRNLIFNTIFSILGFIGAYYIFFKNKKLKNKAFMYGLYFGSSLLIFNTLIYNWEVMEPPIKLAIFIIILLFLLALSYKI